MNSKSSPDQRNKVIHAQYALIVTPLQNMRTRFTENMGQTPESLGRPVVNADNEKILQKYGFSNSPIAGATGSAGATAGASTPLINLHSDGKTTIGWDGKQWVDSTTRQPYTASAQGAK